MSQDFQQILEEQIRVSQLPPDVAQVYRNFVKEHELYYKGDDDCDPMYLYELQQWLITNGVKEGHLTPSDVQVYGLEQEINDCDCHVCLSATDRGDPVPVQYSGYTPSSNNSYWTPGNTWSAGQKTYLGDKLGNTRFGRWMTKAYKVAEGMAKFGRIVNELGGALVQVARTVAMLSSLLGGRVG